MTAYPHHMALELTAKCNFRCPYCYCVWNEFPQLAKPELDTDGWKRIIDRCASDLVTEILFTGGEALLRKDLFDLLDYARWRMPAAKLSLFTNASRLTDQLIVEFKKRCVSLATSLQGLATYGEMTGTRRRFNRLLTVLSRAAELGWPMSVSMTITEVNHMEASDMFVAAALSGASRIQVGAMMAEGRGREHLDLMLTREKWASVKSAIRSLPDAHVPYAFCDEFLCECRDQPLSFRREWSDPSHRHCPAGRDFGVVGPNGRFRSCLHSILEVT